MHLLVRLDDQHTLARLRRREHCDVQRFFAANKDDLLFSSRNCRVKEIAPEHFLAIRTCGHDDSIILTSLAFVHGQCVGQRECASNLCAVKLRFAVRGERNVNKRAAALHRLNMRCTNVAVKAAFFAIVLENHGAVVFTDSNTVVCHLRLSLSRRIDRLLELFIQFFNIGSGGSDDLYVLASKMPFRCFFLNYLENVTFAGRNQCEGVIEFQLLGITELREIRNIIKQCSFLVRLTVLLLQPRDGTTQLQQLRNQVSRTN